MRMLEIEENNLRNTRLQYGITVKEMANIAGCSCNTLLYIELGYTSPVYICQGEKFGKVKPHVCKIAEYFGVGLEDLFPRDFCSIKNQDILYAQIRDCIMIKEDVSCDEKIMIDDFWRVVTACVSTKELSAVIKYYIEGQTYKEIGEFFGFTLENARVVVSRGIRKMRKAMEFIPEFKSFWLEC